MRPRTPQERTAFASIVVAVLLVAIKLGVGLLSHSLGLIAEAIHSATDLVAALLTFAAVRVAVRPADRVHQFGHGKAENLSALAEGGVLVFASLVIAYESIVRLAHGPSNADAHWYAILLLVVVSVLSGVRAWISRQAARRYHSDALAANALHFTLDVVGSVAVLIGLVLVGAGYPGADSIAALVVAVIVLFSASQLMRHSVDVLMDRAPGGAEELARSAIASIEPPVSLRRLRMREAAGKHFVDVVVAVEADTGLAHGHALASAIEEAIERELPGSDVVVHVEPDAELAPVRQRATAAALAVPHVREIHNVTVLRVGAGVELTLHMKVAPQLTRAEGHRIASQGEDAIRAAAPEVVTVRSHIEPLGSEAAGRAPARRDVRAEDRGVREIVVALTGAPPLDLRFRRTSDGLIAMLTLAMAPETTIVEAHARATEVEQRVRRDFSTIADVLVHTEPADQPIAGLTARQAARPQST